MNEENIVSIGAVVDRIEINGYIDCTEFDGYDDGYEYYNILYYLKKYKDLQLKIDKPDELIETYKNERDTYKRLSEEYINKYNDLLERTKEGE